MGAPVCFEMHAAAITRQPSSSISSSAALFSSSTGSNMRQVNHRLHREVNSGLLFRENGLRNHQPMVDDTEGDVKALETEKALATFAERLEWALSIRERTQAWL